MLTVKEIRQAFLDFFESKGHHIVPSAPMVVKDDPTLMFTNAGMNQFKDIILGNAPIKYSRVADSQKCLRVSGKHNDLEEVGHDTYHHTMFEMLGNWSFGDYFKEEAITYAWELLTEIYKLPKDRLYVTVFEGATSEGLDRDHEAAVIWSRFLPEERIINGNKHDNFWEMGDTGPCGPCSEIHIDIRPDSERAITPGVELVNHDHPQVIEIWNLVFMQYNRMADGHLEPLPNKVIDTGMGLERLCMALQGKYSNYDTDVFTPLISKVSELSGQAYGAHRSMDIAMRVIADHIRTIAFSITDGQLPSNAKAGYVIRRILRRAVRYGYTFLGFHEPFMYRLLPTLIDSMGEAYPELPARQGMIQEVIKEEEAAFLRTLENGIQLLQQHTDTMSHEGVKVLDGRIVFELYDTYGFPTDLTELILKEQGLTADLQGFEQEMSRQKERARHAAQVELGDWVYLTDAEPTFVGYDTSESDTYITRYREVTKKQEKHYQVVLSTSPFYAEMGGQVGDRGTLTGTTDSEVIQVLDTIRENNLPICEVDRLPSDPRQLFRASIDQVLRRSTEANHTATHLLHHALRQVLGDHVEQKGSYVSDTTLRFDFMHYSKLTPEQIRAVERLVTAEIRSDRPREEHRQVPIAEAKAMGAMALFGEKYGEEVRVIKYGDSVELCGGTHIPSTGMIGTFRITNESSIAAGIRRIEAVTGIGAEEYLYAQQDLIGSLRDLFKSTPNLIQAVQKVIAENDQLKVEVRNAADEMKNNLLKNIVDNYQTIGTTKVYRIQTPLPAEMAKNIAFGLKQKLGDDRFVFLSGSDQDGKALLTLMLSDTLVADGHHAGQLVRDAGRFIQGGGGGQPTFATAGGKKPDGLQQAMDYIIEHLHL